MILRVKYILEDIFRCSTLLSSATVIHISWSHVTSSVSTEQKVVKKEEEEKNLLV